MKENGKFILSAVQDHLDEKTDEDVIFGEMELLGLLTEQQRVRIGNEVWKVHVTHDYTVGKRYRIVVEVGAGHDDGCDVMRMIVMEQAGGIAHEWSVMDIIETDPGAAFMGPQIEQALNNLGDQVEWIEFRGKAFKGTLQEDFTFLRIRAMLKVMENEL